MPASRLVCVKIGVNKKEKKDLEGGGGGVDGGWEEGKYFPSSLSPRRSFLVSPQMNWLAGYKKLKVKKLNYSKIGAKKTVFIYHSKSLQLIITFVYYL